MGLFEIFKRVIINSESDVEGFLYANATGSEVKGKAINDATFDGWNGAVYANTLDSDEPVMALFGFAKFKKASVTKFNISRAILGVVQKTKIKVAGAGVALKATATVRVVLRSSNFESEFASFSQEYKDEKRYQITFDTTLDYVEFLKDLKALIDKDVELGYPEYLRATLVDNTNVLNVVAPTGILIESTKATIDFDVYVDLPAGLTLTFIADVPVADTDSIAGGGAGANIVQESYEGRNTYEQVKELKLETDGHIYPHSPHNSRMPIPGAMYTHIYIEHDSVSDHVGHDIVDQNGTNARHRFEIYIKEDACKLSINNISRWLDMTVAPGQFYTGTTAATETTFTANGVGAAAIEIPGGEFIP